MGTPSRCLGAGLAALLGLAGCNRVAVAPESRPGPSVLLVTIDTLRADHVGAYGATEAVTPTLDALAAAGARFDAIASAPLTLPSHAAILTGQYPPRLGVRHNGLYRLPERAVSVAERFQEAGYDTGAFVSAFVLATRYGLDQGFDHYDDRTSLEVAAPGGYLERDARATTDAALAWLGGRTHPFFCWVHYYDPHAEYAPPPPWDEHFHDHPYDGEIAHVDAQLARLLEGARRAAGAAGAVVAVTADHGESLGEHQEPDHGFGLYDAVLRVPLILQGPGVEAGRVVRGLARGVDVAPTLLELAHLPGLPEPDGKTLAPLWRGEDPGARIAYAETLAPEIELGWAPLFAARSGTFHYVRAPRPELYDLAADPHQLENLFETDPERARREAEPLEAHVARVLATSQEAAALEADADALSRLHALGYAVPPEPAERSGLDPKDGLALLGHLVEAKAAYAADDFARAETLLRELLEHAPASSQAHALLAYLLLHTGRAGDALPHMQEAVRLSPRDAHYHGMLGEIHEALGDGQAARRAFARAVALDPAEPLARVALMGEAVARGALEEAEEHARVALENAPAEALVRIRIGRHWLRAGRVDAALAVFREAAAVEPDLPFARMWLAIGLARAGHAGEAAAWRERAGDLGHDPWLWGELGRAFAEAGDLERAESTLRALLAAAPAQAGARRTLARVLRARGREEEASTVEGGAS